MTDARFQELLARLLDHELDPPETAELAQAARQNPARARDLRQHLELWELYAQRVAARRSVEVFVASCETRLRAEADSEAFVERVEAQLSKHWNAKVALQKRERPWEKLGRAANRLFAEWRFGLALAGAAALLIAGFFIWLPALGEPVLIAQPGAIVGVERAATPTPATRQLRLLPMDIVTVSGTAIVTMAYAPENTQLELHPGTTVKLVPWAKGKHFELRLGKIEAAVARQRLFKPLLVRTPQAEARVIGTKFTLTTTTNATRLDVSEGQVRLTRFSDGGRVKVPKGRYAIAGTGVELVALPQTGGLLREVWTGIPGGEVNDLLDHPDYPNRPTHRDVLKAFETPVIQTNNYGCRLVGYIHPPVTGDYTFWIASGGYGALWLSPDENPARKVRIATGADLLPRQWWDESSRQHKLMMPRSGPVRLVAGRRYFVEAVQKTATGSSHLEVAWKIPSGDREIISGEFLSPGNSTN